ncbi:hypothetical protein QBC35DRAFT_498747 [Podospora australis]|uniref:MFS transporter n=1 Tax=Podospora australis TaxID=1536484 RepID=A0AAN7AG65_9PEZI|nr:hypothetical protein QBC35DRAFT_498747 [Podospora australis]
MARIPPALLLLLAILSCVSLASASVQTYCKCTCFKNSTIVPLGPASGNSPPPSFLELEKRAASSSCAQCNRAFCLQKMNLPICKDAEEKDVITSCFQRDSRKDQVIVWGFILGTAGLLGWAAVKKVIESKGWKRGADTGASQGGGLGGVFSRVGAGVVAAGRGTAPGLTRRVGSASAGDGGAYSPLGDDGRAV